LIAAALVASCACSNNKPEPPRAASGAPQKPAQAGPVRITNFYAYPEHPAPGEKTLLCYGVENATEVRLEPPVDRVWPTLTRCVEAPARAATYKLIASRGTEQVSQSVKVTPAPAKAFLFQVSVNKPEIAAGEDDMICYNARNAVRVTIEPAVGSKPLAPNLGCVQIKPTQSTVYVVTATGAGGDTSTEKLSVHVK